MKRTNVMLDDELLARARHLTGLRTTRDIVARALRELVDREEQRLLAARLHGSGWDGEIADMRRPRAVGRVGAPDTNGGTRSRA
jgi:Arc/MetJ family transcription regulator